MAQPDSQRRGMGGAWTLGRAGLLVAAGVLALLGLAVARGRRSLRPQWRGIRGQIAGGRWPSSAISQALLGRSKREVLLALGRPRAVASPTGLGAVVSPNGYWRADLWYYPLDERRRVLLAITFARGRAAAVDFGPAP